MAQAEVAKADPPKGYPIKLYVYDLSGGLAAIYSPQLIGKVIEGIWHSSVVLYGHEYFYGGGIQSARPKSTPYGQPVKEFNMGHTFIPQSVFHDFLREVSPKYSPDKYDLIHNNCNNFTNEATQFLLGKNIPEFITGLPQEFLQTPFGQMVQPIIQNMQNQAMANFGDYAGMGIAAEPHLPKISPEFDRFVGESDADEASGDEDMTNNNTNEAAVVAQSKDNTNTNEESTNAVDSNDNNNNKDESKEANDNNDDTSNVNDSKDSLFVLLNEHCSNHSSYGLNKQLKVIGKNEFFPKLTLDNTNASVYAEMIVDSSEVGNAHQSAHISQLVKYIERKVAARKKGLNIILKISDEALEVLDELMLMSSDASLFPLIALLKLLMVYQRVFERYKDLMIVNQILYRTGIPFSDEEKDDIFNNNNNNNGNNDINVESNDSNKDDSNDEKTESVPNLHLLQFNALCAISHLYNDTLIDVKNNVIALGIAGLKVKRTQVRLAATRLLFNILLQCKRQYMLVIFESSEDNRDSNAIEDNKKKLDKLVKQKMAIGNALSKHLDSETHEPTRYRCLVGLSILFYCNDKEEITNEVKLNKDEWKRKDGGSICSDVFNDLVLITS